MATKTVGFPWGLIASERALATARNARSMVELQVDAFRRTSSTLAE